VPEIDQSPDDDLLDEEHERDGELTDQPASDDHASADGWVEV
jgi:hypothetical protein